MPSASTATHDALLSTCPLCDSPEIRRFDWDFRGEVIFVCDRCKVQFMNPQYTDEYLVSLYAKYTKVLPESTFVRENQRARSKEDDVKRIEEHVKPGLFLSLGCGDGLELQVARERGWRVEGYEVDSELTREVAGKLGVRVHSGNLFDLDLPSDHYDCVFLDQVLEHPKNPQAYLREIHRILHPNGVVFIGCPNIRSLACCWKTAVGKLGLKKRRGNHYGTFHHLFYYSPAVLKTIMERWYGFRVVVAEGAPLSGQTEHRVWGLHRAAEFFRRKWPALESTFRLIARKTDPGAAAATDRRAAA